MRNIFPAIVVLAALVTPAGAAEKTVTLPGGIDSTLNVPDGSWRAPVVVMLHGTGSQKDEVGNMYAREAKALADRGVASIRISFRGFGKSDGDMGALTVDSMVADALAATQYVSGLPEIDKGRIGILGFSLGGGAAIMTAGENPDLFKSLVTWSSVGDFVGDITRDENGKARMERAMAEGVVGFDLGWRTMVLKKSFYESLIASDIPAALQKFKGAYLSIAGSEDFSAKYVEDFVKKSPAATKKALILPGSDHIFKVFGPDQLDANSVVEKTAKWFADTL